jgi:hypothetical protein
MGEKRDNSKICYCYPCQDPTKAALLFDNVVGCILFDNPRIQSGTAFFSFQSLFFPDLFFFRSVTWVALGDDAREVVAKISSKFVHTPHPQLWSNKEMFEQVCEHLPSCFLLVVPSTCSAFFFERRFRLFPKSEH